jgi:hypothetical protein
MIFCIIYDRFPYKRIDKWRHGKKIDVQGTEIALMMQGREDYISLTGIAKYRNTLEPFAILTTGCGTAAPLNFWVYGNV